MTTQPIAAALQRVTAALTRRPAAGLHDDATATTRWDGGLRMVTHNADGLQVVTDLPAEVGGAGGAVTPGWLLRAALASCATTCIAMRAAIEGIELTRLEAQVDSRSDLRGLMCMNDSDGNPVSPGPMDMAMRVRVAALGVGPDRLRALVESACRGSPMSCAVETPVPLALQIEVDAA